MNAIFKLDSLRKKIFLYIIVVIALCGAVSTFMVNLVVEYQMGGRYRAEKEASIESLSYSLGPMLQSGDNVQVNRLISSSLIFDNIAYVAVFDRNGALIGSVVKEDFDAADFPKESHELKDNGTAVGSFEIAFSSRYIDNLVHRTTLILTASQVAFLLLAGAALLLFLGRSIVNPIESFTRTIRRINPGNLSVRVDIKSKDEIGLLGESFNRMARQLEESYSQIRGARDELEHKVELRTRGERRRSEQLRAINEVSRRISSILSIDELLPYVVHSLQQTFSYHNVNLFLLNHDKGGAVLQARAGGDGGMLPGCVIVFNEGIVGRVAACGEPVNDGDIQPGSALPDSSPAVRSELAVPIKIGAETLGVLDIRSTEAGDFDEIDLFTAQTLGDQLAVAVENARLYKESREVAVLEERNRMAREIHDTLAQGFTGIILQLEGAEQTLAEDPGHTREHLERAKMLALRARELEHVPFTAALRHQLEGFFQDAGVLPCLVIPAEEQKLSPEIENALLRVTQESLNNIKKHARASKVDIELAFSNRQVRLRIDDNGVGFDTGIARENRFGLISMRERVKLLGGTFEVRSESGKGTHITASLPVERGMR
jgi:nitrate/nitrite-specific signal transduction histidine kinase